MTVTSYINAHNAAIERHERIRAALRRPPPNTPSRGDRCRPRGRAPTGVLRTLDDATNWAVVEWDEGKAGLRFVLFTGESVMRDIGHLFEDHQDAFTSLDSSPKPTSEAVKKKIAISFGLTVDEYDARVSDWGTVKDEEPDTGHIEESDRKTDWGGLGGVPGGRDIDLCNPFEVALFMEFAQRVRFEAFYARVLWDALADVKWTHTSGDTATCSHLRAGDIVAAIRRAAPKCDDRNGDYSDWYQSSGGIVSGEIAYAMAGPGWTFEVERDRAK